MEADVGTWVFGFRFHSNPLVVSTIKEKTKIKHCLRKQYLKSIVERSCSIYSDTFFLLFSRAWRGRQPFAHLLKLLILMV